MMWITLGRRLHLLRSMFFFCLVIFVFNVELVMGQRVEGDGAACSPRYIALPVQRRSSAPKAPLRKRAPTTLAGITAVTLASNKQSYYTLLQAGNISFRIALDTASADLWITSSTCQTDVCKKIPKYPITYQSPTFVVVNNNETVFKASYADGTAASGFVAKESVRLANITVANQTFALVNSSTVVHTDETSGILGLGFPRLSGINSTATNSTPFVVGLAQNGLLEYPLFGLSLTTNSSGSLTLGAIDASVVKNASDIEWFPVVEFAPVGNESRTASYLFWTTPLSAFSVNGTQAATQPTYPKFTNNQSLALIDVGTSGIYGPFQDVSRLYSMMDGARLVDAAGQWAVPCDEAPPISFTFGEQNFTLNPADYIIGPASGNPNLCLTWPRALPPSSDGIDWQFGGVFLRTVYSIFSYGINSREPPMIGFYPLPRDSMSLTDQVIAHLTSLPSTIATTLPNFPLSTPTFTTPPYAFNSNITAPVGGIMSASLGTSAYRPLLGGADAAAGDAVNASGIPTISPAPTLVTLFVTNTAGSVSVSTSTVSVPSPALGVPPGWNAASKRLEANALSFASLVSLAALVLSVGIFGW